MVLEELTRAKNAARASTPSSLGYGCPSDAHHITQPAPEGEGAQRAMRLALRTRRSPPSDVDYINAHGTSTPHGDLQEATAIRHVFGAHAEGRALHLARPSRRWATCSAALGAVEAGDLRARHSRGRHPSHAAPHTTPDPHVAGLDLVPLQPREKRVRHALSNSFGFGGTNARAAPVALRGLTMKIVAGADHAGWELKDQLVAMLREQGHEVEDLGTNGSASVDYPDYAHQVAERIASGAAERGVLVCGTGVGHGDRRQPPQERSRGQPERRLHREDVAQPQRRQRPRPRARVVGAGLAREIVSAWIAAPSRAVATPVGSPRSSAELQSADMADSLAQTLPLADDHAVTLVRRPGSDGGQVNPARAPLAEVRGRLRRGAALGEGGMGEVRLCRDRRDRPRVAMKVMHSRAGAARSRLRARFLREARVQGQLEHPSIVPVYDLGVDAERRRVTSR